MIIPEKEKGRKRFLNKNQNIENASPSHCGWDAFLWSAIMFQLAAIFQSEILFQSATRFMISVFFRKGIGMVEPSFITRTESSQLST